MAGSRRLGGGLRGWAGSVVRILVRGEEQCRAGACCTVLYCAVLYWGEEQSRAGACTSGDTTDTIGPGDSGSRASTGEPGTSRREVSNENIPENMM